MAQTVKNLPSIQETQVQSLGWENALEKETATHSCILAWEIPRTVEPGLHGAAEWDTTERLTHTFNFWLHLVFISMHRLFLIASQLYFV